ncbi:hypothetical protein CLOM_g19711 [Closterium sp. NIES-68]|nr:hypothetical protein CLOM_g19711 [Closterium sp. NIES-68]GJP62038.1 hypothetical protein CLOP_g19142 [Closterium sp. NIES-67]
MHGELEASPAVVEPHFKLGDTKSRFEPPQISPQIPPQISPQIPPQISPRFKLGDAISPPTRAPRDLQLRVAGDASPCKAPRGDPHARVSPETSPSPSKAPRGDLHVRVTGDDSPSRLWFRRTSGEEEARALAQLLSLQQHQQQQQQQNQVPRQPGQSVQTSQSVPSSGTTAAAAAAAGGAAAAGSTMGIYPRCRTSDGFPIGSPSLCSPRLPPRSPRTPDLSQSPAGSSHSSPHRTRPGYSASGAHVPSRELARRSQQWANLRCEAKVLSSALEELVASTVNDWSVESVEGVAGRSGNIASSSSNRNSNSNSNGSGNGKGNGGGNRDSDSNNARRDSPDETPPELSPKEEEEGLGEQRRVE